MVKRVKSFLVTENILAQLLAANLASVAWKAARANGLGSDGMTTSLPILVRRGCTGMHKEMHGRFTDSA